MLDLPLSHRPALASARATRSATTLTLQPLTEGHVLLVLSSQGMTDIRSTLIEISDGANHAVRAAGPGQWFVVGDRPLSAREFLTLETRLKGKAALVDQSHGRIRISVNGSHAEAMLAKGTAVDLNKQSFRTGHTAMTLVGHISVHLTRIDPDSFEILVLRSFAEDLWNDLNRMSAEFY